MGDGNPRLCMPACLGVEIEDLSIVQLQRYLHNGAFSGRALTACYLERIKKLDPILRFVTWHFVSVVVVVVVVVVCCSRLTLLWQSCY